MSLVAGSLTTAIARQSAAATQRRAAISRIVEEINSPDPAVRLTALDDAMQGKDPIIRHLALSTALANADTTLRYAALDYAFAAGPTLIVRIDRYDPQNHFVMDRTGGRFDLHIVNFNRSEATFGAYSSLSGFRNGGRLVYPGVINGDRVSFQVQIENASDAHCNVVAELESTGSVLKGTMVCEIDHYDVLIDVLH